MEEKPGKCLQGGVGRATLGLGLKDEEAGVEEALQGKAALREKQRSNRAA